MPSTKELNAMAWKENTMPWGKRAAAELEELPFWVAVAYLPLMGIMIVSIITLPNNLMGKSLQPVQLDQSTQARQLHAQLWATNQYTGETSPFDYTRDLTDINKTITLKKMAYSVSVDGTITYHNKQFYDIARPLVPFSYSPYVENRTIMVRGTPRQLVIEEYYPYNYEVKRT